MGYIPLHSLENLKKYSYKGVDRCVHDLDMKLMILLHFRVQVNHFALCIESILELVCYPLAVVSGAQYGQSS
jgi:hypothetical protein